MSKGCQDQCTYIFNPARQSQGSSVAHLASPRSQDERPQPIPAASTNQPRSRQRLGQQTTAAALHSQQTSTDGPVSLDLRQELSSTHPHGYLGPTSYHPILIEGLQTLSCSIGELGSERAARIFVSKEQLNHSYRILSFLELGDRIDELLVHQHKLSICNSICLELFMKTWLNGLWEQHAEAASGSDANKTRELAQLLWVNTKSPLKIDGHTSPTASTWARTLTGAHIRWEVIGIIAASLGLCIQLSNDFDALPTGFTRSKNFVKWMLEVSETCISFCTELGSLNDLFLWLLYERARLVISIHGGGSYQAYRAIGESNDALLALGLHRKSLKKDNLPFFISEIRKRLLARIYVLEISTAAFLGRPPRLLNRHCNLQSPLDLDDSQVVLEASEISTAIQGLDSDGFSLSGRPGFLTLLKVSLAIAQLREEVLDVAVSDLWPGEVHARCNKAMEQHRRLGDGWPSVIRHFRDDAQSISGDCPPTELLFRIAVRLDWRSTEILIQRILIKRAGENEERLIVASRAMLSDFVNLTKRFDVTTLLETDWMAMLVMHGLRCALIVAVELLKLEKAGSSSPILPRSAIIRDLSVFSSRLSAVDSTSGHLWMCSQCHRFLDLVLDRILEPAASLPSGTTQGIPGGPFVPDSSNAEDRNISANLGLDSLHQENGTGIMSDAFLGVETDDEFLRLLESINWSEDAMLPNWST